MPLHLDDTKHLLRSSIDQQRHLYIKRKTWLATIKNIIFQLWKIHELKYRIFSCNCGRRGGALDSESSGPGSRPGRGHCVVFMARHFTLTVPLSTQLLKTGTGKFNAGGNPAMD